MFLDNINFYVYRLSEVYCYTYFNPILESWGKEKVWPFHMLRKIVSYLTAFGIGFGPSLSFRIKLKREVFLVLCLPEFGLELHHRLSWAFLFANSLCIFWNKAYIIIWTNYGNMRFHIHI